MLVFNEEQSQCPFVFVRMIIIFASEKQALVNGGDVSQWGKKPLFQYWSNRTFFNLTAKTLIRFEERPFNFYFYFLEIHPSLRGLF